MTGEKRRQEILKSIQETSKPLSGSALAKRYQVSRQVIVQDIALLRAANYDIYSTNRGYLIHQTGKAVRTFAVAHTDWQIEDELSLIVDNGGSVKDVVVEHDVYGRLAADLSISSRRDINEFISDIESGKSEPLKNLTSGLHFHRVEAESEEILDVIEQELKERGYLVRK